MEYIFAWQSKNTISNWGNIFNRKCICCTLFKFGVACIMLLFIAPFTASRTVELLIFIELININLIFGVSNHARFFTGCSFVGTFVLCFGDILLTIYIFLMRNDHRQKYVWYTWLWRCVETPKDLPWRVRLDRPPGHQWPPAALLLKWINLIPAWICN